MLVGDFLYSRAFQMMVRPRRHAHHGGHGGRDQHHRRGRSAAADERQRPRHHRAALPRGHLPQDRPAVRGRRADGGDPARRRRRPWSRRWRTTAGTSALPSSSSTTCSITAPTATELGKNLGDDLAEGKPTLPLIYALAPRLAEETARMRVAVERAGSRIWRPITRTIESAGGLEYTGRLAQGEGSRHRGPGPATRVAVQDRPSRARGVRRRRTY